jgi:UDP-N-acetylmuramyl pentapeptide phosphotransferase/UDP-N-acetylglucosamine-1-phosphate transferase
MWQNNFTPTFLLFMNWHKIGPMSALVLSFLFSFLAIMWIIRYSHLHSHLTADSDLSGVQKFHVVPVPRIGGAGIIVGIFLALSISYFFTSEVGIFGLLLIFSGLPAFAFGLIEDLTKKVGVKVRLLATIVSAGLAGTLLNAWLISLQVLGIDNLMIAYPFLAIVVTCIAVRGVANSFNIIWHCLCCFSVE